ncbi:MAG: hypothetical protein E7386_01590 [Ruminococcaceae bacterium]|nr:hypothetical protein [Oscillospiraceae bacterium]
MRLPLFCDEYIIAERLRLKIALDGMPRYKIGTHNGLSIIREYSGFGAARQIRSAQANGKAFDEMQKSLEKYNAVLERERLFLDEFRRRRLIVPADFGFARNKSIFNAAFWDQLVPCSNNRECNTEYFDDYGFNVRSRGEMIVGNALKSLGLEAKYEPRLALRGSKTRTPDYSFPVHIIDRCFFVEFLGMSDDEEYIDENAEKIRVYMRNGILPNRDLILISGTRNWIPSQESIARHIASFVNNAVLDAYDKQV